jgi:hypothetical protein
MQIIPIVLAASEMVLAKDIKRPDNPEGPPICGKGMELTEQLIERLKTMGVQTVTVDGHPVWMEGDKAIPELLEMLEQRFSKVSDDQLMLWLKECYRIRLVRSMGECNGG